MDIKDLSNRRFLIDTFLNSIFIYENKRIKIFFNYKTEPKVLSPIGAGSDKSIFGPPTGKETDFGRCLFLFFFIVGARLQEKNRDIEGVILTRQGQIPMVFLADHADASDAEPVVAGVALARQRPTAFVFDRPHVRVMLIDRDHVAQGLDTQGDDPLIGLEGLDGLNRVIDDVAE